MISVLKLLVAAFALWGLSSSLALSAANNDVTAAAEAAKAVPIDHLTRMYQARSWIWDDGAGYFQRGDQKFTSWVGSGDAGTYAEGKWYAAKRGRLCFQAIWHAINGSAKATTCFEHRADEKAIYQRRLPKGGWYIFTHLPPQPDDAIQKLKSGNQVSNGYSRNKRYIIEKSRRK